MRIQFYKPMHDFLTGNTFSGNYDLPPHGVLVLDEHPEARRPEASYTVEWLRGVQQPAHVTL